MATQKVYRTLVKTEPEWKARPSCSFQRD